MVTCNDGGGIMVRLKESTVAQHDAAENGLFQQDLVKGKLPKDAYVDMLAQLLLVHAALEKHLRQLENRLEAAGAVLREHQFQEPYLREDLRYFGRDAEAVEPFDATRRFIDRIEEIAKARPLTLLGVHYVLEGSNNGSKYIAKAVRRAYSLPEGPGTRYLDPYGDNQKEYWQRFKDDMNSVGFSQADSQTLIEAASETFAAVGELHQELYNRCVAPRASTETQGLQAGGMGRCPISRHSAGPTPGSV